MRKRVAVDTITEITSAPDFAPAEDVPPAPSREELIAELRKNFSDTASQAFNCAANLEKIIKDVPAGFDLVPVFYRRVESGKNASIQNEYLFRVRDHFLRFLAENHERELKNLGICEEGIARMKNGLDPVNEKGMLYNISIDHIIERSGCGLWGEKKEEDPARPGVAPKYRANHFGNLILLPHHVHEFKNSLNALQGLKALVPGEGKWILMLVPKRDAHHSGFVAPPQGPGHRLHGIHTRAHDASKKIGHTNYVVARAHNWLDLTADKNAPDRRHVRKNFLRPALKDVAEQMKDAFNFVSSRNNTPRGKAEYGAFVRFYQGRSVQRLKARVQKLPFKEAIALRSVFARIDLDIPPKPLPPAKEQKPKSPSPKP